MLDNRGVTFGQFIGLRNEAEGILREFGARAGIVRRLSLSVSRTCPGACVDFGIVKDEAYVFIPENKLLGPRVDLEWRLAHEIGHVAAGHVPRWKEATSEQREQYQDEANAYALRLMGEARYREHLASVPKLHPDLAEMEIERLREILVQLPSTAANH